MFDLTLTFDNGPDREATPAVLNLLAQRDIRSTFFVIGQKLADPELRLLAARAHDEGHWIGNHTFTHSEPLGLQAGAVAEREIAPTQELIGTLSHPDKLFRPMGGGGNLDRRLLQKSVEQYLADHRYTCVIWNSVPGDWRDPDGWVETALGHCLAQPWTLVVLHDLPKAAPARLDAFLGHALDLGARFRQDFPPDCILMRGGQALKPLSGYLSD